MLHLSCLVWQMPLGKSPHLPSSLYCNGKLYVLHCLWLRELLVPLPAWFTWILQQCEWLHRTREDKNLCFTEFGTGSNSNIHMGMNTRRNLKWLLWLLNACSSLCRWKLLSREAFKAETGQVCIAPLSGVYSPPQNKKSGGGGGVKMKIKSPKLFLDQQLPERTCLKVAIGYRHTYSSHTILFGP